MTPERRALANKLVLQRCLTESAGDTGAALQAAGIVLSTQPDSWLENVVNEHESMEATLAMLNDALSTMKARGAALSLLERKGRF